MVEITNIKETKKASIIVSFSIIMAIIFGATLGRYAYINLKKTHKELNEQIEVQKKLEANLDNLKKLNERKDELLNKNKLVLEAIPNDEEVSNLFFQLDKITNSDGLKSNGIIGSNQDKIQSSTDQNLPQNSTEINLKLLTYTSKIDAPNYTILKNKFDEIFKALRIVSITEFEISKNDQDNRLGASIKLKTYSRGEK